MRNRSEHDPPMIRPHTRPSRNRRTAEVDHRGSGTDFVWKNIGFRASAISQKRISCETSFKIPSATPPPAPLAMPFALRERSYSCKSQWNSIGNSHQHHLQSHLHCGNDPTVANHNGILSTAHARKTGETPFTMRNRSEHDPPMIRPHTRPSRNRRTAEVDHRGSGTDFVWKNIGFRASAISQKRISCETSFKTPSATPPPAPLAMPFALRERSYSCKSQWNSIGNSHQHHLQSHLHCRNDPTVANHNGILSTAHARKTGETPFTMRNRSEHDPPMIRPHTRPSRNRRTAEVDHRGSGTDFVWKNIGFRASAISQKRISCETSFKPPSATPPPAPLAMPF